MEFATIEREIAIEASPEIVFEVITTPEHIRQWWNGAETGVRAEPGTVTDIGWAKDSPEPHVEELKVIDADPPRLFSFRWVYTGAVQDPAATSLLVTFELVPTETGTLLKLTETGFREKGWDAAVIQAAYEDHSRGWDIFVPSLGAYAASLVASQ